jgi:hypothetical protein
MGSVERWLIFEAILRGSLARKLRDSGQLHWSLSRELLRESFCERVATPWLVAGNAQCGIGIRMRPDDGRQWDMRAAYGMHWSAARTTASTVKETL